MTGANQLVSSQGVREAPDSGHSVETVHVFLSLAACTKTEPFLLVSCETGHVSILDGSRGKRLFLAECVYSRGNHFLWSLSELQLYASLGRFIPMVSV